MAKVADVVKDKIVGVKDVLIYELNLTDGTTQLHQLADKVQVTMDMPFALADIDNQGVPCRFRQAYSVHIKGSRWKACI